MPVPEYARQHALFELAKLFVSSQNPSVSGRALRRRLIGVAPTLQEQRALAESLVPEFAEHIQANSQDDYFRPTFRGLLLSYPPAKEIVALTLQFFRQKAQRDPELRTFSWDELRKSFAKNLDDPEDVKDYPQLAVLHVLEVAGLSSGWYGSHWGMPGDIEELLEVRDVEQLLERRSARTSTNGGVEVQTRDISKVRTAKVFIGHGTSPLWTELRDFIRDQLQLEWEEFNRQAVAGRTTQDRLKQMLESCSLALLVMTGDDTASDGSRTARPNVVHELGLFQGKLGFERAIVLLENGCAEFSNIVGLTQIRFAEGRISEAFEDIRRVLEREGLMPVLS